LLTLSRISEIPISSEVLTSIKIPPLKSIPKFNPINKTKSKDNNEKIDEKENANFLSFIKFILVLSEINRNKIQLQN